ncbi:hypothetical protein C2S51_015893 [Perilla frutescens var. frutescens]|nr:hypothetical protein C2S51_015893 [Perilla frutescens var. frutescens]
MDRLYPEMCAELLVFCAYQWISCWVLPLISWPSRQRDPLSPSLFLLASDYLSRGVDKLIKSHPDMIYHTSRNGFPVSHLAYADDILIFIKAKPTALSRLMGFLTHYSTVLG